MTASPRWNFPARIERLAAALAAGAAGEVVQKLQTVDAVVIIQENLHPSMAKGWRE